MKFTKSLLALSLLSFSAEVFAVDYTWGNDNGNGIWEEFGNWSLA